MQDIITELKESRRQPSIGDISRIIASVGKPGEKQGEKQAAVRQLFSELGLSGTNPQGFHVADDLTSYGTF